MQLPAAVPSQLQLTGAPSWRRQAEWGALCVALVPIVAVGDYLTGYELSLSILYLGPVLLATWTLGLAAGIALSLLSILAWLLSVHLMGHTYLHPFYYIWDAVIRFATWIGFALVLQWLKLALAHADERFVTVLAGLDAAVYVNDPRTGELLYMNRRCDEAFGPSLSTAADIDRRLTGRGEPRSDAAAQRETHDAASGRWYLLSARSIRWIDGRSVSLCIATDVTDRKSAEALARQQRERLEMTSRLTTLGEMASTLAHEINQPLSAISNYCMGCVRRLRSGDWKRDELLDALEKAAAQAERAGAIIQRMRAFLRKREPDPAPCDLNALVSSSAQMIEREAGRRGIRMRLELSPRLPQALADQIMIEQVMLNLIQNAMEAMQFSAAPARDITIRTAAEGMDRVVIEVADRGPGLPEQLQENLFVPFFTTKPEGMGMGLQICRSIVERHGGRLTAASNPGGGTVFRVALPALQP